ncbi:hypothetical protein SAMN02745196_03049 [Clostridium collagenovorans DSM 3089]|uniref:Uncharacterized protein n=1 Tax=Clostridium collagenovorans DSM 3089 TaxID=1121306 RepID=A0A1M5YL12_9CLOT|nr:hypothetical protein [Clostridium collagenovorans]SHI12671.1 hypothetical protein SAMN02745196_03049 [Clostridium collagenovorans DSM 3089]
MIKSKSHLEELIQEVKSFTYAKDSGEVDVALKDETVSIRYDMPKCIVINFLEYEQALSLLYKDRKYINQQLFS